MKYNLLLKILRILMYGKRFLWWTGKALFFVFGRFLTPIFSFFGYVLYKVWYLLKKMGFADSGERIVVRDVLQVAIFVVLIIVVLPQTKVLAQKNSFLPGQKTLAFNVFGGGEQYGLEEVIANQQSVNSAQQTPSWKTGIVSADFGVGEDSEQYIFDQEITGSYAGGLVVNKPHLMPGSFVSGRGARKQIVEYIIEPGDSLSVIAAKFGINVATILWENNLSINTRLKLGQKIIIPPASGVMHMVKKGDTLAKIAKTYGAKSDEIIAFNNLDEDGKDLRVGERIMVPGGTKPTIAKPKTTLATTYDVIRPSSSRQSPSASGFVWPAGVRTITQYFHWRHNGMDIAGPFETAIYAAKAGTVAISQCGWNGGYGCYVVINHGGGVKTVYGHNSRLLVSVGEYVETGQTIALMGNTGNVRGRTGIHLHFEVQINGARVNPLGYVR